jgi:hypothetical protein
MFVANYQIQRNVSAYLQKRRELICTQGENREGSNVDDRSSDDQFQSTAIVSSAYLRFYCVTHCKHGHRFRV